MKGLTEPTWQLVERLAPLVIGHRVVVSTDRFGKTDSESFIRELLNCFSPIAKV